MYSKIKVYIKSNFNENYCIILKYKNLSYKMIEFRNIKFRDKNKKNLFDRFIF
jgi:hypothetical protein